MDVVVLLVVVDLDEKTSIATASSLSDITFNAVRALFKSLSNYLPCHSRSFMLSLSIIMIIVNFLASSKSSPLTSIISPPPVPALSSPAHQVYPLIASTKPVPPFRSCSNASCISSTRLTCSMYILLPSFNAKAWAVRTTFLI